MDGIKIAMSGPDAANPNNRRLIVDGSQWAKVYGMDPEQAQARADLICKGLAGPLEPAVLAYLDADTAFRDFERENPNNSTSRWDAVFYARNDARDELYRVMGRELPR